MGLGKTLSILSRIVESRQYAIDFALSKKHDPDKPIESPATLIIVPSARKSRLIALLLLLTHEISKVHMLQVLTSPHLPNPVSLNTAKQNYLKLIKRSASRCMAGRDREVKDSLPFYFSRNSHLDQACCALNTKLPQIPFSSKNN
jgi:hypothetical protein